MLIDGKALADTLLSKLAGDIAALKKNGITPTLQVILIGDNPASLSYIRQKQKAATAIGALVLVTQKNSVSPYELRQLIDEANKNTDCHGLIIQRPVPSGAGELNDILRRVAPRKDIDGFVPGTAFTPPVAVAVVKLLTVAWEQIKTDIPFDMWLASRAIAVIGKGETAGKPINDHLRNLHCTTSIIDTKTEHPAAILKRADIIISCVGKKDVVTAHQTKHGVILISVGIWRDFNGKLHGDYDEEGIQSKALFYTPTPGGVGPVNVACLMENLVTAAGQSSQK